ncbi:hypothetical protein AYO40_05780 [Planctomycetaceae bacterium SCGC AG-212-D15]|nr:hypothetical protein AYO40_05780 [Planctomycetaceae bacterium SCGC AG-212-D15]
MARRKPKSIPLVPFLSAVLHGAARQRVDFERAVGEEVQRRKRLGGQPSRGVVFPPGYEAEFAEAADWVRSVEAAAWLTASQDAPPWQEMWERASSRVLATLQHSSTTETALREYLARWRLNEVEESTDLSRELARLDEQGFGRTLADELRTTYSAEVLQVCGRLQNGSVERQRPVPARKYSKLGKRPTRGTARWVTVTEAAQASGCSRGQITRAADKGSLKSNGKKGPARLIDPADLTRWQLRRAEQKNPVETHDTVAKKLRAAQTK